MQHYQRLSHHTLRDGQSPTAAATAAAAAAAAAATHARMTFKRIETVLGASVGTEIWF